MIALRRAVLAIVALTAVTAVLAGLARLGVELPLPVGNARAGAHGPLFVLGVFGTVVALERAVAYGKSWAYVAPLASAGAAALMLAGVANASLLAVLGASALVAVNAGIVRRQRETFTWLMLGGSLVLVAGNASWTLGRPVFEVVPAWVSFFVLTIVAERLELSRLTPTPRWASRALVGLAAALVVTLLVGSSRATGAVLAAIALWELRFDIARRTVRMPGLPRFSATGVLLGAAWLLAGGLVLAASGMPAAGPLYDAVVHAVMVGFVLSMVFAHAPIILPAVARIPVPFHPALYAPLAVLELGLVARVLGDVLGLPTARTVGGTANALALVFFLAVVVTLTRRRGARDRAPGGPAPSAPAPRSARAR